MSFRNVKYRDVTRLDLAMVENMLVLSPNGRLAGQGKSHRVYTVTVYLGAGNYAPSLFVLVPSRDYE